MEDDDAVRVVERHVDGVGVVTGYRSPELLHLVSMFPVRRSFTEKPLGAYSIETLLSVVNLRTEIRFFLII